MSRRSGIFLLSLFCLGFALLGFAQPAYAQVLYGSVSGSVTDPTGAAVAKAHIVATNRATSFQRETEADENGHYLLPDLPPGSYDLKVTATGFKPLTQTNLTITANTVTNADVRLQVGAVSEQVTVEASTVTLQTEKTDLHTDLTEKAIQ